MNENSPMCDQASADPDTKLCPYCAETIKAAASVCRYCGHELGSTPAPAGPAAAARGPADVYQRGQLSTPVQAVSPKRKKSIWPPLLVLGFLLLAIFFCAQAGVFSGSTGRAAPASAARPAAAPTATMTAAQLQKAAKVVAFDALARGTEQYVGDLVSISGTILQVLEDGSEAQLRVNVDGDFGQTVFVQYPGYASARVLEGDKIRMVGVVDGRITYTAVMGNKVTLPALTARWLKVVTE